MSFEISIINLKESILQYVSFKNSHYTSELHAELKKTRISSKRKVLQAKQKNFIWKEVKMMNQKKT